MAETEPPAPYQVVYSEAVRQRLDQLSDAAERWLAAEITREQVFLQLHDELPYAATVESEGWE